MTLALTLLFAFNCYLRFTGRAAARAVALPVSAS